MATAKKPKPKSAGAAAGAQAGALTLGYQTVNGPGGAWHIYPNGRKVWVAARAPAPPPPNVNNPLTPDAQYTADMAQRNFQIGQERSQIDTTEAHDRTDYAEALRRLVAKKPQDIQNARVQANRQGRLDSTTTTNELGELETNYTRQTGDMELGFRRRESARTAAREALARGLTVDEASAAAALTERQTLADTQAADAGMLAVMQAPPAPRPLAVKRPAARKPRKPAARKPRRPARRSR